ncbi:MAG: hypothetical protein FWG59_01835, partial [Betaproteobacteria bacterium]|nr:hypothetical protein [Betaproteobacteria bacterium]
MKKLLFSGAARILCAALILLFFAASVSLAASWRWSVASSGRERLVIILDEPDAALTVNRSGTQTLSVNLTKVNQFSAQPAPEQTKLFTGAAQQGTKIELSLSNPAFGYIVMRPSPVQVIVDVYPDPLGERWRPPAPPSAQTAVADAAQTGSGSAVSSGASAAASGTAPSSGHDDPADVQGIRAPINKAGPEAWPQDKGLSSGAAPLSAAPAAPV